MVRFWFVQWKTRMNLSKSDLVNIGFQTIVGAFFTAGLSVGSLLFERKKGRVLAISTQRLHLDYNISSICGELQRRTRDKGVGLEEYGQIINAIDHIMILQHKLQTRHTEKNYQYSEADEDFIFQQLTRVYNNLKAIRNQAFLKGLSDGEVIDIELLCKKIVDPAIKIYLATYVESAYSFLRFAKWKTLGRTDMKQPNF